MHSDPTVPRMISGTSSSYDRETREDVGCGGAFSMPEQPARQASSDARTHRLRKDEEWRWGGRDSVIDNGILLKARWRAEAVQSIRIPPGAVGITLP